MVNYEYYTYRVIWSKEDGEYAGLCAEFPSLSWLAEGMNDPRLGIEQLVRDVVGEMKATDVSAKVAE